VKHPIRRFRNVTKAHLRVYDTSLYSSTIWFVIYRIKAKPHLLKFLTGEVHETK